MITLATVKQDNAIITAELPNTIQSPGRQDLQLVVDNSLDKKPRTLLPACEMKCNLSSAGDRKTIIY
jgi:hypothetical protein